MRLSNARTMEDIIKYLKYKGNKQDLYLVEVEQVQNMLIVTYGKPVPENEKEKEGEILIWSSKIKKDKEIPMAFTRVTVDLCNFIEPYKSKKDYYKRMRDSAVEEKNLANEDV